METRRLLVALLASMGAFLLWLVISPRLFPAPTTQPAASTQPTTMADAETPADVPATAEAVESVATTAAVTTAATPAAGQLVADGAITQQTLSVGSVADDSPYPMEIQFTNRGAAIETVHLRDFKKQVGASDPYPLLDAVEDEASGQSFYSFATAKLRIETFQQDVELADLPWSIDRDACTETTTVFHVTVRRGAEPVLEASKTYTLAQAGTRAEPGTETKENRRHDVTLTYSFRNLTPQPLSVILVQRGPVGIHREDPRTDWRGIGAAIREGSTVKIDKKHGRKEVVGDKRVDLGQDQEATRVEWLALANKYFACVLRPDRDANSSLRVAKSEARSLTRSDSDTFAEDLTYEVVLAPLTVPASGTTDVQFDCYLGPKSKVAFEDVADYAAHNYMAMIEVDFYCCAPAPVAKFMMWLLQKLYWPVKNYGVAIILLVLIVRAILHPITKAGQVNMMKMQKQMGKLQPKIDELKRKHGNDKQKISQETMELYREAGISPASQLLTCLPMGLQLPIWAGLWAALSSIVEMRHAPFDGWWIKDLAGPDALIPFGQTFDIPLLGSIVGPVSGFNLLPILLSVTMYLQQKLMPKASASTASKGGDQMAQQQKMMSFMTIFFGLMLYNAPSGLNLYIMSSNLFGIIEQWRIRKHVKVLEEREKAQPAGGSTASKLKKPRFFAWLEKKAEEAKKLPSDKPRR